MVSIETRKLFWCIPFFLTIHNIEEAVTMPAWIPEHLPSLRSLNHPFASLHFSSTQLYISLVLVTVVPLLIVAVCQRGALTHRKAAVMITLQSVIFWNAIVPHAGGIFVMGMYNPGTVTALLFNIPFSLYGYRAVRKEGFIPASLLHQCIAIGLVVYLPLVYGNHLAAESLASLFTMK